MKGDRCFSTSRAISGGGWTVRCARRRRAGGRQTSPSQGDVCWSPGLRHSLPPANMDAYSATWGCPTVHSRRRSARPTTGVPPGKDMMRSQPTIPVQPSGPIPAGPAFPILESKLAPALGRPGIVSRANLLDWLEASAATPVVAICAPAGYGKTVLAAEWAERDPRPFVWLSIDRQDNDPAVLLTYLAVGLDRVEPIDPAVFACPGVPGGLDHPDGPSAARGRLVQQGAPGGSRPGRCAAAP